MITHPDKLMFPDDGITKGELAAYYESVAPVMLPHLARRPVTMERFPSGIAHKGFLQKDVTRGFPDWLQRVEVPKKGGTTHYPLVDDLRGLLWLANQNCITPHVWTSRVPELERPDLCVFDLDPSRDDAGELVEGALAVRTLLAELGVASWIKTSGSKGYHIVVPLDSDADFETCWHFSHACGALLVKRQPERFTQEFLKSERGTRILIDTGRNGPGATIAATYAVRARPGAPVSAPCTWAEVESGSALPRSLTLKNVPERLARDGDPWASLHEHGQSLTAPLAHLRSLLTPEDLQAAHAASTRRPKPRKR